MDAQMHRLRAVPVLVVDEDSVIRDPLRTLLQGAGCLVAVTASEAEALEYLRGAFTPHVVLLDFFLPLTARSALLHAAEHDDALRLHCYVLVTATTMSQMPEEEQGLIREICYEVLPKPLDALDLLAVVARAANDLPTNP